MTEQSDKFATLDSLWGIAAMIIVMYYCSNLFGPFDVNDAYLVVVLRETRQRENWHSEKCSNEAHESSADNRHGLTVSTQATQGGGTAERDADAEMFLDAVRFAHVHVTIGADKNCDTAGLVVACRANGVTPHVARNDGRNDGSAIDDRTTRWRGFAISQRRRKCIGQVYGWGNTAGRIRLTMYRGHKQLEQLLLRTQAAYNLTRLRTLATKAA
jgi:hypothetical protein